MSTALNDEQKAQLTQFLLETARETKDLVQTEAPLLFEEMVTYGFYYHSLLSIFGAVLLGLTISALIFIWNTQKFENMSDDARGFVRFFSSVVSFGFGMAGTIMFLVNVGYLMQVYFSPRVYVMEWLIR